MSYFNNPILQRENYINTLNILEFFLDGNESYRFNSKDEYVVTWFDKDFYTLPNKTQTAIKVRCLNLTNPIYISKNNSFQHENNINILIPIDILHKVHIGSIWVNGISNQRFKSESFSICLDPIQKNYNIYSIAKTYRDLKYASHDTSLLPIPFDHTKYIDKLNYDRNQLIVYKSPEHSCNFVIHPLIFFLAHYGYSTTINQLISTYEWSRVEKKLLLNEAIENDLYTEYVILPNTLTQRDAVFLYHLKYDKQTYDTVKRLNNSIINSKSQASDNSSFKILCWHDQPIKLVIQGYKIGDTILCSSISTISEPLGEPINLILPIKYKRKIKGNNQTGDQKYLILTKPYIRPTERKYLDITRDPVNNIVVEQIIDELLQIGQKRLLNKIYIDTQHSNKQAAQIVTANIPENFGVGEMFGDGTGSTGLLQCIFKLVESEKLDIIDERIQKVWEHAKEFKQNNAVTSLEWFSFEKGFCHDDNIVAMPLNSFYDNILETTGPQKVFIIRLQLEGKTFYILEFGLQHKLEKNIPKGFSAIVYKEDIGEDFLGLNQSSLQSPFIRLLAEIISLNGSTNENFIDGYNLSNKKVSTFIHKEGKNNNWVQNGINKLL